MALHTLEMVVRMQTGDVMSGLNDIENKVVNLVDQVSNFKPNVIFSDNQVQAVAAIADSMKTTDRFTGLVNDRNLESYLTNLKDLETAVQMGDELKDQVGHVEGLVEAQRRYSRITDRIEGYYDNIDNLITSNANLLEDILDSTISVTKLEDKQVGYLKELVKNFDALQKANVDIEKKFGLSKDHVEEIEKFTKGIVEKHDEWLERQKEIAKYKIESFLGNFNVVNVVIDRFKDLHKQFENNRAVVNQNISTIAKSGNMYAELADIQADAAMSNILLSEAQESLTGILARGAAITIKDADALTNLTKTIAQTERATGASTDSLAVLATTMVGLTDNTDEGAKTIEFITGAMSELGISTANTQRTVDSLTKGLAAARTFMTTDQMKEYQAGMALIGSAATEAGLDAASSQELFSSFTDPLQRVQKAALLTAGGLKNLVDASPEETLRAAAKAAAELDAKVQSGQMQRVEMAAQMRAMKIDPSQVQVLLELNKKFTDASAGSKNLVQMQEELAAAGAKVNEKLPEDGTRKLTDAVDDLVASLTPISNLIDKVVGSFGALLRHDVGKWIAIVTAGFVTYFKVIKPLGGMIAGVAGSFSKMVKVQENLAGATSKLAGSKGGGGFLASFAKSFRKASQELAKINFVGVLKGAAAIALVGISLGVGLAAMAWAASQMEPTDLAQLSILLGGLLIATALLIPLGPLGAKAMLGALAVGIVGAALAGGIYLLGKAVTGWDSKMIKNFIMLASGLLIATGILALIGIPAVAGLAVVGALTLIAVAAALTVAMMMIETAMGGFGKFVTGIKDLFDALSYLTPDMGSNLTSVGVGLAAFAAALVGGELAKFFSVDIVSQAAQMAMAMQNMQPAIESMASIGGGAANAFKMIGEGLLMMSRALAGGGIMSLFTGDTVKNAQDLARAMGLISGPVTSIGEIGAETAMIFNRMAFGLKNFVAVLKEDAGWFTSFEENAEDMAAALSKISEPMKEIMNIQQGDVESAIRDASKIQAEEIKSALALTIDQSNEHDEEMLEKLEAIKVAIEEHGGVVGGASPELVEEMKRSTDVLQSILSELSMGSFGNSVADTRYIT